MLLRMLEEGQSFGIFQWDEGYGVGLTVL